MQLLSQCGSMLKCLSRSVPEIHLRAAGTLSNQQTTTPPPPTPPTSRKYYSLRIRRKYLRMQMGQTEFWSFQVILHFFLKSQESGIAGPCTAPGLAKLAMLCTTRCFMHSRKCAIQYTLLSNACVLVCILGLKVQQHLNVKFFIYESAAVISFSLHQITMVWSLSKALEPPPSF